MKFFVLKDGVQQGPYSAGEIQDRLDDGRLLPTDLSWHEGAAGWQPIHSVPSATPSAGGAPLAVVQSLPPKLERYAPRRLQPYYADDHERDKRNEGFNPAISGWIVFGIAIGGLVCFSYLWLPVAIVLFFVVFVLSIVALVKGRVASGAIMLCALVIIGPVAGFVAPLILPGFIGVIHGVRTRTEPSPSPIPNEQTARAEEVRSSDVQQTTAVPVVTPFSAPLTPTPPAFLADVKYSQAMAMRRHPDLGRAGSPLNTLFLIRLKSWQVSHDARLNRSDWPEALADDCAAHP